MPFVHAWTLAKRFRLRLQERPSELLQSATELRLVASIDQPTNLCVSGRGMYGRCDRPARTLAPADVELPWPWRSGRQVGRLPDDKFGLHQRIHRVVGRTVELAFLVRLLAGRIIRTNVSQGRGQSITRNR